MIARSLAVYIISSLLLIAGLSTSASASAQGKRIALFVGPTQDKYLGGISKGFIDEATAAGMKVTVFSSPFDPTLQAQQIDDGVAQKYDMLVVQPISQKAVLPPLMRAKTAGIPVILVVVPLEGRAAQDLYLTYAGYDDTALGAMAGDAMAAQLAASGRKTAHVVIIAGSMDEGKAPLRQKAFVKALAAHPGIEVLATEDVKWDPVKAEASTGQLLARLAGKGIDGVYGMNDTLANAAIQAVTAAGPTPGAGKTDLVVVGGNCQTVGVENIKKGVMAASVLVIPTEEGVLAAKKAVAHFAGETLEKAYYLAPQPLTAANIANFAQRCSY